MTSKRNKYAWVYRLKRGELLDELDERGLDMTGSVEKLRERLAEFLRANSSEITMGPDSGMKQKSGLSQIEIVDRVRKWNLTFDGGKDVFGFLERIDEMIGSYLIPRDSLLPALPLLLKGKALLWYRNNITQWKSWDKFISDFKNYFLPPRFMLQIEDEIKARTQGPAETVKEYVTAMQTLIRRSNVSPEIQVERIYQNLRPEYTFFIHRDDLSTLPDLVKMGEEYEQIRMEQARFKPPPNPAQTFMPEAAYQFPGRKMYNTPIASIQPEYNSRECCWRCGQRGHNRKFCQRPAKLFCSRCGKEGVYSKECCLRPENGQQIPNSGGQSGITQQRPHQHPQN